MVNKKRQKRLVESIMTKIQPIIKKTLNESFGFSIDIEDVIEAIKISKTDIIITKSFAEQVICAIEDDANNAYWEDEDGEQYECENGMEYLHTNFSENTVRAINAWVDEIHGGWKNLYNELCPSEVHEHETVKCMKRVRGFKYQEDDEVIVHSSKYGDMSGKITDFDYNIMTWKPQYDVELENGRTVIGVPETSIELIKPYADTCESISESVDNVDEETMDKEFVVRFKDHNGEYYTITRGDYESMPAPMNTSKFDDSMMRRLANDIAAELRQYNFDETSSDYAEDIDDAFWKEMEECAVRLGMTYYEDEEE